MVQIKRKVTIRQKHAVEAAPTPKSKAWIFWLAGAAIMIVAGILFFRSPAGEEEPLAQEQTATAPADTAVKPAPDSTEQAPAATAGNSGGLAEQPASRPAEEPATGSATPEPASAAFSDADATALDVIRGIYGNGQTRRDKLGEAYQHVQNKVNEMYRKGLVH